MQNPEQTQIMDSRMYLINIKEDNDSSSVRSYIVTEALREKFEKLAISEKGYSIIQNILRDGPGALNRVYNNKPAHLTKIKKSKSTQPSSGKNEQHSNNNDY